MDNSNKCIEPVFQNSINIVLGADNTFFLPLVVCIQSIISHTSDQFNYDIIILSQNFNNEYLNILESMIKNRNNISIRVYDITYFVEKFCISKLKTGHRLSSAIYYRLFIPELMNKYDKVIYLDGDTIILEDLKILFSFDIKDMYAGAVIDYNIIKDMSRSFKNHVQTTLEMNDVSHYFNSGVLILNINLIRKNFTTEYFIHQAEIKGEKHHDQDVLNSLFYGKVSFLPPRYNSMWMNEGLYSPLPDGKDAVVNPAIIHFTGGVKPWLKDGAERPAARYFWKYAELCPYYNHIIKIHQESWQHAVAQYKKQVLKYLWYRLLASLLWGRKKRHYTEKSSSLQRTLNSTRKGMREKVALPWKELS